MPRRTTACRRVSHCVIYSPGASKMPLHAMGSKNSAYAGASGAHRLAWRPDSVAIITKNGGCSSECPPVLLVPSEPVRVDLSRPDEVVRLVSARPHVLLHLDHRHPFAAILVALGRGAFGCACHGSSNLPVRHRASTPRGTVCLFVCTTIEPPDCGWRVRRERRRVEVGRAGRVFTKRP